MTALLSAGLWWLWDQGSDDDTGTPAWVYIAAGVLVSLAVLWTLYRLARDTDLPRQLGGIPGAFLGYLDRQGDRAAKVASELVPGILKGGLL